MFSSNTSLAKIVVRPYPFSLIGVNVCGRGGSMECLLSKNLGQLEVVGVEKVFCRSPSFPACFPKGFENILQLSGYKVTD